MRKKYERRVYSERWQYVKDIMTAHGKSVTDMAHIIGECPRTMNRSLVGDRRVDVEEMKEIAQALQRLTGKSWEHHAIEILRRRG